MKDENKAIESFIEYCDDMMIVEEGVLTKLKNLVKISKKQPPKKDNNLPTFKSLRELFDDFYKTGKRIPRQILASGIELCTISFASDVTEDMVRKEESRIATEIGFLLKNYQVYATYASNLLKEKYNLKESTNELLQNSKDYGFLVAYNNETKKPQTWALMYYGDKNSMSMSVPTDLFKTYFKEIKILNEENRTKEK